MKWKKKTILTCIILLNMMSFHTSASLDIHRAASTFKVSNPYLEIIFDASSGAIRQVTNQIRSLHLVKDTGKMVPWILQTGNGYFQNFSSFSYKKDESYTDGDAYDLSWETSLSGISIAVRIELPADSPDAHFYIKVINTNLEEKILSLEYPIISGIAAIQPEGGVDLLAHPVATGYLFKNPYQNFQTGDRNRKYQYPDGYAGASMQFMEYYREDSGGFYFSSSDDEGTVKNINFYKDKDDGYLWASFEHFNWDTSLAMGMELNYPVNIGILTEGNWYEGAERYKRWAVEQNWCQEGTLKEKDDSEKARWLLEDIGLSTFGISINLDQTAWFDAMHDLIERPVFHISGFWWPGGTESSEWYGGYNDWSDGRVHMANIATIHSNGDYIAPFLFNQHFNRNAHEWDEPSPDPLTDPVAPWQPFEMIPDPESDPWAYMCPSTQEWQNFHGWRDEEILKNYDIDASYYDIGVGLGRMRCENIGHGHPEGRGRWMVEAARAMLENNRDDINKAKGGFVPQGTEMISELFISQIDFYQSRAGAGPMSMLEGDEFREAVKEGWAEKIPLFEYVYHEYGPIRLDGNAKLAPEFGDIFYWIAGRIALWGALLELNYELSALELFPGMPYHYTWYETYKPTYDVMDITPYWMEPDKKEFIRDIAKARTEFAKDYLCYGIMTRPAKILSPNPVPEISLDWHLYNTFKRETDTSSGIEMGPEYYEHGVHTVESLLHQAWNDQGETLGLVFVNLQTFSQDVELEIDPSRHGLEFLNYAVKKIWADGQIDIGSFSGSSIVSFDLPPRKIVLLKVAPVPCEGEDCLYRVYRSMSPENVKSPDNILEIVMGHSYSDDVLNDGVTYYYLVDDGAGYPVHIDVQKSTTIDLTW